MSECILEDKEGLYGALEKHYGGQRGLDALMRVIATSPRMTVVRCQRSHFNEEDPRFMSLSQLEDIIRAALGPRASHYMFVKELCGMKDLLGLIPSGKDKDKKEMASILPPFILDVRCGEAVLRGANAFAPGVISCHTSVATNKKVALFADIRSKQLERGAKCKDSSELLADPGFAFVGIGIARMNRGDLFYRNAKSGVAVELVGTAGSEMPSLNGVAEDCAILQNLPSVFAGYALAPAPGMRVLDMCAAPGGKTTHLAAFMQDKGEIIAVDRRQARVDELNLLLTRLGVTCVKTLKADSTHLRQFDDNSFDAVLLDAPCSGIGLRPRLSEPCKASELSQRGVYQRKLMKEAVRLVKPGGTLVYSVCTMNPDEGENVVAYALRELAPSSGIELVDALPGLKEDMSPAKSGLTTADLDSHSCSLVRRFTPPIRGDECSGVTAAIMDVPAFFLAKFIKKTKE